MTKSKLYFFAAVLAVSTFSMSVTPFIERVFAASNYSADFESGVNDWAPLGVGDITPVSSNTNEITSAGGLGHAVVNGSVYTSFGGYESTFPANGYTTEVDVYLDPTWTTGTGFDYAVASNGSDGLHQRDFVFHVAKDTSTGNLLVGGSNNTNFNVREDLESLNNYDVNTAGWYTLQHDFYNDGGQLAVDLNLLDSSGTTLFTETRTDASDTIPAEVGGHRYGWFTVANVPNGLAIDNASLVTAPAPVVCDYDFPDQKMWEVTWGYGFEDRNGGAPVFTKQSNSGLETLNGEPVPEYMASPDWHWLYVTDNGDYNPRHYDYGFADGTTRTADVTFSEVNGCQLPNIVWGITPPDNKRPSAQITNPSNNSIQPNEFTIEGLASDDESGIDRVQVYVSKVTSTGGFGGYVVDNQSASYTPATETFTHDVSSLETGDYKVKAVAFDGAGNSQYANTVSIEVDADRPSNVLFTPAADSTQPGNFKITGKATDSENDVTRVAVKIARYDDAGVFAGYVVEDDANYDLGTGNYSYDVTGLATDMDQGYRVLTTAYDSVGNPHSDASRPVFVDATNPHNRITHPANGDVLQGSFTVEGTTSDDETYVDRVSIYVSRVTPPDVNGKTFGGYVVENQPATTYDGSTGEFTYDVSGLIDGDYKIKAVAYDAVDNKQFANTVEVTVDNTDPNITFVNPSRFNNQNYNRYFQNISNIEINATDENNVVSTVVHIYNADGTASSAWCGAAFAGDTASCDASSLSDGDYFVKVAATDEAGNSSYDRKDFTIDNSRPGAHIDSPSNGFLNSGNFTIIGTAGDDETHVSHVNIFVSKVTPPDANGKTFGGYVVDNQSAGYDSDTGEFTYDVSGLIDGDYKIKAVAYDAAGNAQFANTVEVTIDSAAPALDLNNVLSNSNTSRTITGTGQPNEEVKVTVHSTPQDETVTVDPNGAWSVTFDNLEVGTHTVEAVSTDAAGNSTTDTKTFEVLAVTTQPSVLGADTQRGGNGSQDGGQGSGNTTGPFFLGAANQALFNAVARQDGEVLADNDEDNENSELLAQTDSNVTAANSTNDGDPLEGCATLLGVCWYYVVIPVVALIAAGIYFVARRRADT